MQKAIFIDRDGVINKDPGGWTKHSYVTRTGELIFIDGSIEAIKNLKEAGFLVFVVSNQGGVSKGYFSEADLKKVNEKMLEDIRFGGGNIDEVLYCIHHDKDNCECRKPKTGLMERAVKTKHVDLKETYMIGDTMRDIEAGKRMGMKTMLVLSGKASVEDVSEWQIKPDYIKNNLLEAVSWILKERK